MSSYCEKCGQSWAVHEDDGSCVIDLHDIRQIHFCPTCNVELQTLLFLGIEPDGYVCPACNVLFHPDTLKPLAHVIGMSALKENV